MADEEYTSINIKPSTKKTLELLKIIPDETWDSLLKRIAQQCKTVA
jgi:hypothetical protein